MHISPLLGEVRHCGLNLSYFSPSNSQIQTNLHKIWQEGGELGPLLPPIFAQIGLRVYPEGDKHQNWPLSNRNTSIPVGN